MCLRCFFRSNVVHKARVYNKLGNVDLSIYLCSGSKKSGQCCIPHAFTTGGFIAALVHFGGNIKFEYTTKQPIGCSLVWFSKVFLGIWVGILSCRRRPCLARPIHVVSYRQGLRPLPMLPTSPCWRALTSIH